MNFTIKLISYIKAEEMWSYTFLLLHIILMVIPWIWGRKLTQKKLKENFWVLHTIKVSLVKWCNWQTIHIQMTKYQNTLKEKNKSGVVVNFSAFETPILSPENLSDIQTKWKRQQNLYIKCDTECNVLLSFRRRKK